MRRVTQLMASGACALSLACGGAEETAGDEGGEAKTSSAPDLSGKADGRLRVDDRGRFSAAAGVDTRVSVDAAPVSWRVHGFGETRLRISVRSPGGDLDAYAAVAAMRPAGEDPLIAFNDDAPTGDTFDAALEVTLPGVGGFEILAGTYDQIVLGRPSPGELAVTIECLSGCGVPELSLHELVTGLRAQLGAEGLQQLLADGLPALFPDPSTAALVQGQVSAALAGDGRPYPSVPMAAAATAQGLFESTGKPVPVPPAPVEFELIDLLSRGCATDRPTPTPVHPAVPGLMRGSFADLSLTDCEVQRGRDFANVLNNLSLDNGSAVTAHGVRYESVEDVFRGLLDAEHHVVVENSRYLANFLGLIHEGRSVVAPVWLDTGIPTAGGGSLQIPAPHTHHTIHVRGPLLNTTLFYYLGVDDGVSFRAVETIRPDWSGERVLFTYDSAVEPDAVVRLIDNAARLRRKWTEAGRGLPAQGYGALGVCNDSTAVLEFGEQQTITVFPLAHPPLEGAPADAVDQVLAALPSDLAGFDPAEAVARIALTMPYEDKLLAPVTAQLRALSSGGR